MNPLLIKIINLIEIDEIRLSAHGYDELVEDNIFVKDVLNGVKNSIILEYYPDFRKGPCLLLLQKDSDNKPIHIVWGIPKDSETPAVLITGYRPDPDKWSDDFTRRLK